MKAINTKQIVVLFPSRITRVVTAATCLLLSAATLPAFAGDGNDGAPQQILPNPVVTVSTVPANGDVNPYGVAFVPPGYPSGTLQTGDILVSNFNNSQNLQGTGMTIVRFDGNGKQSLFFQGKPGIGLSTALNISQNGPIFAGNLPTADGTCATAQSGSIFVLNGAGQVFATLTDSHHIDGPWDSTLYEHGNKAKFFVANSISGTISRIDLEVKNNFIKVLSAHTVASGYVHRCDPATLFVAPTGLVYDVSTDTLYVASAGDNAIFAVPYAGTSDSDLGTGHVIFDDKVRLHGALAMTGAPNGHLLVTNSDGINPDPNQPSEIVEFTKNGTFVAELPADPAPGGSFGLGFGKRLTDSSVRFAAVDDNANTLTIWKLNFDDSDISHRP